MAAKPPLIHEMEPQGAEFKKHSEQAWATMLREVGRLKGDVTLTWTADHSEAVADAEPRCQVVAGTIPTPTRWSRASMANP